MGLYDDVYIKDWERANPKALDAQKKVEMVKGWYYQDVFKSDGLTELHDRVPKFMRSYTQFNHAGIFQAKDGRVIEVRLEENANGSYSGNFTAAIFPDWSVWNDWDQPMSYITWAMR